MRELDFALDDPGGMWIDDKERQEWYSEIKTVSAELEFPDLWAVLRVVRGDEDEVRRLANVLKVCPVCVAGLETLHQNCVLR